MRTTCAPGPRAPPRPAPPPARPAEPARTACAGEPPAGQRRWDVAGRAAPRPEPAIRARGSRYLGRPAHPPAGRAGDPPRTAPGRAAAPGTKTPGPREPRETPGGRPTGVPPSASRGSGCQGAKAASRAAGPSRDAPGGGPAPTLCAALLGRPPSAAGTPALLPHRTLGMHFPILRVVSDPGKSSRPRIYTEPTESEKVLGLRKLQQPVMLIMAPERAGGSCLLLRSLSSCTA